MCNFYTIVSPMLNFAVKCFTIIRSPAPPPRPRPHDSVIYTSNTTKYIFLAIFP